jgi:hypothetical protein
MQKKRILFVLAALIMTVLLVVGARNFIRARATKAGIPRCVRNLRMIDSCKRPWMYDNRKTTNDIPSWEDLRPYFPDWCTNSYFTNGTPICPDDGTYVIGRVDEPPRCSIGGPSHSVSQ